MKKAFLFGISFLFLCFNLSSQYVTIEGRQFKDENGNDFYPVACNYSVFNLAPDPVDLSTSVISPHSYYGEENNDWDCGCNTNQPACSTLLENDLKYLLSLGFNAIRVMGFEVVYYKKGDSLGFGVKDVAPDTGFYWFIPSCAWEDRQWIPITNNPQNEALLFQRITDFLIHVYNSEYGGKKMKVTLLTGRLNGDFNDSFAEMYKLYLESLASYIDSSPLKDVKQTLFAYELFNEPKHTDLGGPSKKSICQTCKMWYYSLKEKDPNHLITMGAGGNPHAVSGPYDVLNNDVSILTLDFYSPHAYSALRQFEYDNLNYNYLNAQLERLNAAFFWLQQNSPMPWLIGEIGLQTQSEKNPNPPAPDPSADVDGINGTLEDLKKFIDTTLTNTFECSGSGYSFWDYQGTRFGLLYKNRYISAPPDPCDPPPACCHSDDDVKPAHKVFESFSPTIGGCQKPDKYYDPYKHKYFQILAPPDFLFGPQITGWVWDADNNKYLEDAYVEIESDLKNKNYEWVYDHYYTYTDENGEFTALPMNYYGTNSPIVGILEISVPGGVYFKRDLTNSTPWPQVQNNEIFNMHMARFKYSDAFDFNNATILNGPKIIQAWNDLTVRNIVFTAESGNGNEIKARRTISIMDEFHATKNSEVHIYTTPTFCHCSEIPESEIEENTNKAYKTTSNICKTIETVFVISPIEFDFELNPNPNNGIFTVSIKDEQDSMQEYQTTIFSSLGKSIYTSTSYAKYQKLNLNEYSKGIYIIRINKNTTFKTKKLVIN